MRSRRRLAAAAIGAGPMAADRAAYAGRQARLLRSLISGENFPAGFAADKAAAASLSLRHKRGRAVMLAWPALAHALGDDFEPRFDVLARAAAAPAVGGALADGLSFARGLPAGLLSEQARVELLLARARLARERGDGHRRRRGVFLSGLVLHEPRRLLLAARLPLVGVREVVVGLPSGRCAVRGEQHH